MKNTFELLQHSQIQLITMVFWVLNLNWWVTGAGTWHILCVSNRHEGYFNCIRHEQLVIFMQRVWRNAFLGCIVLPWSWADSDSWCCWYFRAIASVFFNCLCISYDIMNAYILPQMTVISKKDWNIFLCLLEHTPFPILTLVPSRLGRRSQTR